MFAPYCGRHGSRILLPTTAIRALESTDNGMIVQFECICGEVGTWRAGE